MKTYERTGSIQTAAMSADMCRRTAAKYIHDDGIVPRTAARNYRTRLDPFDEHWEKIAAMLSRCPIT